MSQLKSKIQTPPSGRLQYVSLLYILGILGLSLLCFHPSLLDYTLLPRFVSASFVFLLLALFLGIKNVSNNPKTLWPQLDWTTGLLLAYVGWSSLSISWATNFSEAIFESQKGMIGFATFYICRWFQLNDDTFIPRMLKTLVFISAGIVVFASWQIYQLDTSLENAHYKIRGISGHKNLFSITLFLLIGFLGIAYFKLNKNWRKAAIILIATIFILIIYLRTRSVYLGTIGMVTFFLFHQFKQKLVPKTANILGKGIGALVIIGLLLFLYLWQSNQLFLLLQASKIDQLWQSDTGYERLVLWEKTACVIRQSPIWGVGAGNWQIDYPNCSVHGLYAVELDFSTFQRPHNDWLWVWAETGIIGLFCYLGFFISLLLTGLQNIKKNVLNPNLSILILRLSFILGYIITACFSFPKERIEISLLIYTLMGLFYPMLEKQNVKSMHFAKLALVLIILNTSLNLFIGTKRIMGEKAMKEVLVLKQQKKWSEMIDASNRAFSKWYTIDPTTIPIHWYRGTANFVLGKAEKAKEDFLIARTYTPYNQHVHNDLGSCYETQGQTEKARIHYKESIRISPLFDDPRINMGITYFNEGQYEEALDWIDGIQNQELKMKYKEIINNKINKKE